MAKQIRTLDDVGTLEGFSEGMEVIIGDTAEGDQTVLIEFDTFRDPPKVVALRRNNGTINREHYTFDRYGKIVKGDGIVTYRKGNIVYDDYCRKFFNVKIKN